MMARRGMGAWLPIILVLAHAGLALAAGDNLLINPTFEGELASETSGWSVRDWEADEGQIEVSVDAEVRRDSGPGGGARTPVNSVRIAQTLPVYSSLGQVFDVKPRTIYAAEVWARGEDLLSTGGGLRLFVGNEARAGASSPASSTRPTGSA